MRSASPRAANFRSSTLPIRAAESYFRYAPEADKPALARRILRQAAEFGIEIRSETILRWAARTAKR